MGPYSCSLSWQQGLEPEVRIKTGKIQAPSSPKPCLKASAHFAELLAPPSSVGAWLFCCRKGEFLCICQVYSELLRRVISDIKHLSFITNRAPCQAVPGLDAAGDTMLGITVLPRYGHQPVQVWGATTPHPLPSGPHICKATA